MISSISDKTCAMPGGQSVEGFSWFLPVWYETLTGQTQMNQISYRYYINKQGTPDSLMLLTGMSVFHV